MLKSRKLESVGTLAGGIAHDFNNILAGILGNISLAKLNSKDTEKATELLSNAERAAQRASTLTNQLLTFSKGGAPLKETISIAEIIRESVEFALHGSNVRYQVNLPDDLWAVEVDPGQIDQVINNLVINADQAMPSGGAIRVTGENRTIDSQFRRSPLQPGNYVRISIADTGVGIPEEDMEQIFDPYFSTKELGHGLGLATCYSIIQKHGGKIEAESEPDAILCDISMPKLDGYEVLEEVRQHPDLKTTPFIFLTGTDGRREFRKGMELGADDFIPKPFSKVELFSALQTQLRKHEERVTKFTRELQEKEEELNRLLRRDELTGLPNRHTLQEKFTELRKADEPHQQNLAVLSLSLDRFGYLNDSLGREEADQLLQIIARRLTESVEELDVVARMQAAEFAILLTGINSDGGVEKMAKNLLDTVREPIQLDSHEIRITGSLGIALYPKHRSEVLELLECSSSARSLVRSSNGDDYRVYSEEIESISSKRIAMESTLRNSLDKNVKRISSESLRFNLRGTIPLQLNYLFCRFWTARGCDIVSPGCQPGVQESLNRLLNPIGAAGIFLRL